MSAAGVAAAAAEVRSQRRERLLRAPKSDLDHILYYIIYIYIHIYTEGVAM